MDAMTDLTLALSSSGKAVRYRALLSLANVFALSRQHTIAASYADRAIQLDPQQMDAYEMLGVEQTALGLHDLASGAFERAIRRDPKSSFPYLDWANDLLAQGRVKEAIPKFQEAIKNWPGNLEAKARLAYALYEDRQYQAAADPFTELLAVEPRDAQLHNNYANDLRELIKLTLHTKEPAVTPACAADRSNSGLGDALAEHREAITLAGTDQRLLSRFHLDLGKTLSDCGDVGTAEQELILAGKLDPTNAWAPDELGHLYERGNRFDQAALEYARAIDIAGYGKPLCNNVTRANSAAEDSHKDPRAADQKVADVVANCRKTYP
jgi:tetratricopeptide (TPR) repeat protein